MATFDFYTNSGLTVPFTGNFDVVQNVDNSTGRQDLQLWLGSTATGKMLQADSAPGVDHIMLSVADAAVGTGHPASEVKLALTQAGLDSATGGVALDLGATINSTVGSAVTFWIGVTKDPAYTDIGTSTELSVTTQLLRES